MDNFITPNFSFAKIIPEHALGSRVWDTLGEEYIDFLSGIAVNALGHCHPELIKTLNEQAQKLWHISNLFTTEPTQALAKKLVNATFADKVFFANSGAEANEAALKLARKYTFDHNHHQKNQIISCQNSFHGRTLFTVSVGGQKKYQDGFAPLVPNIQHIPFNDINALNETINYQTCAFIVEPIQGESGVLSATESFLKEAQSLCKKFNALLIFDEVQTGMGRTGSLFAYQHFGVEPDILTSAKALGAGLPIGAMLTTNNIASSFTPGSHGTTFGGNPLICAVAQKAFDIINNKITLNHVKKQGEKIQTNLKKITKEKNIFKEIRGLGLLIGCVLDDQYRDRSNELVNYLLEEHKVIVSSAGPNVIRFAPSLLINDDEINEGLKRVNKGLLNWS